MMPSGVWVGYGVLMSAAAVVDGRQRRIPNGLVALATVLALAGLIMGVVPWTHGLWAVATWLFYEWRIARHPGTIGWGDVKWAAVTMAIFGGAGGLIVGMGHLGVYAWGTWRWWRCGRTHWAGQAAPWAPGAWFGWLLLGVVGYGLG